MDSLSNWIVAEAGKLGFDACDRMRLQSPLLKKYIKKRAADLYYSRNIDVESCL